MKMCCAQGLAPSKHPNNVPLRRKTKRNWRGRPGRDQLGYYSNSTKVRSPKHGGEKKKESTQANTEVVLRRKST